LIYNEEEKIQSKYVRSEALTGCHISGFRLVRDSAHRFVVWQENSAREGGCATRVRTDTGRPTRPSARNQVTDHLQPGPAALTDGLRALLAIIDQTEPPKIASM
jgi:hypothetical protein